MLATFDGLKKVKITGLRTYELKTDKTVKTTMLSGHVLYGTLIAYSKCNFLLNVYDQLVPVYRHAVHQFEIRDV